MSKNDDIFTREKGAKTMIKANVQNEKIKHKYYDYLKESQGYSEATITAIKKSIYRYEEFTDFEDFSKFSKKSKFVIIINISDNYITFFFSILCRNSNRRFS